jgi:hypothetical protein
MATSDRRYDQVESPRSLIASGGLITLIGDLAAATALGNGESAEELVNIAGFATIAVEINVSGVTSDPAIEIIPMAEDETTELTAKAPSAVDLSTGDNVIEYTNEGHLVVKIKVTCDSGDAVTIDKVNVTGVLA